jgi:predicted alpha/beta-hydrolase family hydrolase
MDGRFLTMVKHSAKMHLPSNDKLSTMFSFCFHPISRPENIRARRVSGLTARRQNICERAHADVEGNQPSACACAFMVGTGLRVIQEII